MWHQLSFIGKVLLFLTGVGFGMAGGFYWGKGMKVEEKGNKIEVTVETGKVKKGADVNVNLNGTTQGEKPEEEDDSEKSEEKKKDKKWFDIF